MGKKEDFLASTINGLVGNFKMHHPRLTLAELEKAGLVTEIQNIYKMIGGICESFPINYRWDIQHQDFILELDEELHFNRYRLMTLDSAVYVSYPYFSVENYKSYCKKYEDKCLMAGSYGGKWKNISTERYFLPSSPNGKLDGNGSSRWRQRAFYDYLKDIHSLVRGTKVIRVSIYDKFNGEQLKYILEAQDRRKLKMYLTGIFEKYQIKHA